ncbi:cell division protein SepF [Parablautia sp. Marseille-Q6255]|uniref:cell division protein SepF n=1 Tax=Parablautia sp. Marseille-Q6255 TaxID=3039593 RepID=UPI0024BCA1DB|nr:cell division protein SepF [Parablautia sp. Marseille-Q6255]
MGVLDKFLNAMKMNDDEGFDDDYLDDEYDNYDDYEEERPKKRLLSKSYDDDYDDSPQQQAAAAQETAALAAKPKAKPTKSAKISPMRPKRTAGGTGMEVCVIRPKSMEDAREITETLLEECTVVLNMEGLDLDIAQRIIDFASGSCYAIHGNLQKISNYIFIITPESVDISGDFQEILSGAFEVPTFGTRF